MLVAVELAAPFVIGQGGFKLGREPALVAAVVAIGITVVVVILVRMGLVTVAKLKEVRPYAIVGAFVIAAIVTPPDAVSMFSLAVPMCLLFELGLLVAPMFVRMSTAPEEKA